MKSHHHHTACLLSLALAAGCASGPSRTQKQQAHKEWTDAQAGVLGSLASDQYKNGNFDKCGETLDQALRLSPENPGLHLLAAKLAIEQGKLDVADTHLGVAAKLDPKAAETDYLRGVVLQRWQQPGPALAAYDAAVRKDPDELSYVLAKAETLVALQRTAEALDLLRSKASYFEHSGAIRDGIGQLLMQQKRFAEAATVLREASILAADDATIREHLAFALYYSHQFAEAGEAFARLLRDDGYAKRADCYAALGGCQCQTGRLREARESLETAAGLDPTRAGYWLELGRVAVQLDDLPRADLAVRKALTVEPGSADAQCLLGYVRLRQNQLPAALAAFRAASDLDAADTVGLCMQGYVLTKQGHADQAMGLYGQAMKINPRDELAGRLMAAVDSHE